jgi:hypothetical protein
MNEEFGTSAGPMLPTISRKWRTILRLKQLGRGTCYKYQHAARPVATLPFLNFLDENEDCMRRFSSSRNVVPLGVYCGATRRDDIRSSR